MPLTRPLTACMRFKRFVRMPIASVRRMETLAMSSSSLTITSLSLFNCANWAPSCFSSAVAFARLALTRMNSSINALMFLFWAARSAVSVWWLSVNSSTSTRASSSPSSSSFLVWANSMRGFTMSSHVRISAAMNFTFIWRASIGFTSSVGDRPWAVLPKLSHMSSQKLSFWFRVTFGNSCMHSNSTRELVVITISPDFTPRTPSAIAWNLAVAFSTRLLVGPP
mmetsp:Transcript_69950/g.198250  ORF Transcript_69950/g.198250 Transcript_69950/m.198250 type:complete len:224 (-) Transcript_69950:491-1162(-)